MVLLSTSATSTGTPGPAGNLPITPKGESVRPLDRSSSKWWYALCGQRLIGSWSPPAWPSAAGPSPWRVPEEQVIPRSRTSSRWELQYTSECQRVGWHHWIPVPPGSSTGTDTMSGQGKHSKNQPPRTYGDPWQYLDPGPEPGQVHEWVPGQDGRYIQENP